MDETKICKKCGRILPLENFRLMKGQFNNPYYLGHCKECEYKDQRAYLEEKNKIRFSDNLQILIERKYKTIKQERILDISDTDIIPIGTDEIFVKLMDYKNTWLSNYGRVIRYCRGKYNLLSGTYDSYGVLRYTVPKNIFYDGKWIYKSVNLWAAKTVVEEFIVNPDKANNIYIWHSGYDKQDNYYRNLYPLNQEQYRIVKKNYKETGDDSEEFILKVMNDIRYKPENWSIKCLEPIMCGIGYHGYEGVDCRSESYLRWHDMINRCYNDKFHERNPQYKGCTVCEEWLNYSNFKVWYEQNKIKGMQFDLDKDILFKGNKEYSAATVVFVPHEINTLFVNCKKNRGDYPVGVHFDKEENKYRAGMSFMGERIRLGRFDTVESAFARYKEYKEDFIKDIAEQYKDEIPDKVYQAMLNWVVEIGD